MIDLCKFIKEHTPLCICTLGIAVLGYLGYHAVRWIINKCCKTEKIDRVAQKAMGSAPSEAVARSSSLSDKTVLQQQSEKQKFLAATKIQSACRGHIARLALKKLQDENLKKRESATSIHIQSENPSTTGNKVTIGVSVDDPGTRINEVIEFDKDGCVYRIFPDGTKEWGKLERENQFVCAYRIAPNGHITFIAPYHTLANYTDKSSDEYVYESIIEIEGRLIVLEEVFDNGSDSHYVLGKNPLKTLVWNVARNAYTIPGAESLKKVLTYPGFVEHLSGFIENALALNKSNVPRLFSLHERAIIEIIVSGKQRGHINPLSVKNLFIHASCQKKSKLIETLTDLFPDVFQSIAEEVVEELIIRGHTVSEVQNLIAKMNKKPAYSDFWLEIAEGRRPSQEFERRFTTFSPKLQKLLYQAAFAYNNTFLHEPADLTVTPDRYSINLMWINKNKMPDEQEFLFGNGLTFEERELDFQKRFISPVSNWAKKNPGSFINIWIDNEMASAQAIERSRVALETALKDTPHGEVHFRDVRSIKTVTSHPQVFSEAVPVYFRVDLLRAIAADHVLTNKENQFFVYGDIDMEPLSAKELFDKRTVTFLEDFGFVMAKGGHHGFENGFQILNGNNPRLMDSHRKVIINLTIEMAVERPSAIKEQQVYDAYPAMATHFLDVDGRYGKLAFSATKLSQFRYDRWTRSYDDMLPVGNSQLRLRDIMPRKPVRLPPSHF